MNKLIDKIIMLWVLVSVLIMILAIGIFVPLNQLNPIYWVNKAELRIQKQECAKYEHQKELQNGLINANLSWKTNDNSLIQTCAKFGIDLN